MYGRYQRDLSEAAREEARRLRRLRKRRRKDDKLRQKELEATGKHRPRGKVFKVVARMWMYSELATSTFSQYVAWVSLPVCLILFASGFVHIVAAQSIGSGIPEMKTILRGVHLKEYLTFRALISKVIGLTATLGSGLPLGKEGPSVHIASMVATLLSKLVTKFQGIYSNESRTSDMLAAACAVGVASCFAAPVGGVLFSIEVTTTYFAVRNYWRGFFAACCSAIMFRLLSVWSGALPTVKPLFPTNLPQDFPFDPQEFAVFVLLGIVCGLLSALWVFLHRQYVLFMRNTKTLSNFLQKNRFIYPGVMTLAVMSVLFPPGIGRFMAADLGNQEQVLSLMANFTWADELTAEQAAVVSHWETPEVDLFGCLCIYFVSIFFLSMVSCTLPVPAGIFVPAFKMGAALGRLTGEIMHYFCPLGVAYGGHIQKILPGGYATVGAAAFTGAVTHTVSTIVIVSEMTGQVTHILPMMAAVLAANATASLLQPSCFDSIILIKKLPYLPDLLSSASQDQKAWERLEMAKEIDFDRMLQIARKRDMHPDDPEYEDEHLYICHIDPAPFQLVERTSLLKVHSLFSTLGVSRAYVTAIGRLIGVVSLKELRKAIEDVNSGALTVSSRPSPPSTPPPPLIKVHSSEPAPPSDSETAKLTTN
ncbi:Chloride channel protein 2 [Papilio machaon]|uniref:Chloride channel protein 2 n=1 Tax=Papilio machaon TaxID=76193 RepID=A0A0N1I9L5_PAPMA|nr:Chloride channel protein 2 [Papilio machaon]